MYERRSVAWGCGQQIEGHELFLVTSGLNFRVFIGFHLYILLTNLSSCIQFKCSDSYWRLIMEGLSFESQLRSKVKLSLSIKQNFEVNTNKNNKEIKCTHKNGNIVLKDFFFYFCVYLVLLTRFIL